MVDYLFGPLEETYYCNYFLVLTVFGFTFLLASLCIFVYDLFNKKTSWKEFIRIIMISVFYFVFYLQSRILYSICQKTI